MSGNLYLVHHGIKGQRWGVRRYQNPDGSLTAEGKMRYETIEKGSTVRRVSGVKEKVSSNPAGLYAYGPQSAETYQRYAALLPSVNPTYGRDIKKAKVTQYEFTKDAKLLSGNDAVDNFMKEYGNVTLKDFKQSYNLREGLADPIFAEQMVTKYSDKKVSEIYSKLSKQPSIGPYYSTDAMRFAHAFMHFKTSDLNDPTDPSKGSNISAFAKKYKDLGYDAIIDPEDYSGGFEDPYLVMNPDILRKNGSYKYRLSYNF